MTAHRKKLIEVALPLDAINKESAREKSIRHGHPSTLHLWWARRPLAACRAVLFGQLVDDPSSWPEVFPTEREQDRERQRLFRLIEELVKWENSDNATVLDAARLEIARSFARGRLADGEGDEGDRAVLGEDVGAKAVRAYLAEVVPPVHDPFAGGGSIPLEAQRLGLRAIATDLNPVAVLINKALIEIPPKFAGRAPVGPLPKGERQGRMASHWPGASGLAEDVRRYGAWMREEAYKRIGHLYPEVELPKEHGGGKATVIAWLWARTVESPNPAFRGVHVPLLSSFWLSQKKGGQTWLVPVIDGRDWRFDVRSGNPVDETEVSNGTKLGRGATFRCLVSGSPIEPSYVKQEAQGGRLGVRITAVVAQLKRGRVYLPGNSAMEDVAASAKPSWIPETALPERALGFNVQHYGISRHADLFTSRQLTGLSTLTDLLAAVQPMAEADARRAGWTNDERGLEQGGQGARAYAEAVTTYLAFAISKVADGSSVLCRWMTQRDSLFNTFAKNALSMVWDFAEVNVLADCTRSLSESVTWTAKAVASLGGVPSPCPRVRQMDARDGSAGSPVVLATDPPYYDNVPYANLSDFFYVWLRRSLRDVFPSIFGTMLVPKASELIAEPYRQGGRSASKAYFEHGMFEALRGMAERTSGAVPAAIFYAFRQTEGDDSGTASTGWDTFLSAAIRAHFAVEGTWPLSTERVGRSRDLGSNALASSIVLVCRKRPDTAATVTRGQFRRLLRAELPQALRAMEKGSVAPVDLAQASIGPGMAIFSRHAAVLEADDQPMTVRAALQLINEVVDEIRGEEEGDLDRETRFAVTWFETRGFEPGPYGEAEVLATARAVSVQGVKDAGLLQSTAGKVRLLKREELPADWDPATDTRPTVWEATQHLIKRLDEQGEAAAGALLARLGDTAEAARVLAYRLYTVCERRGWAEEGRAYNGLVVAWPDLEKLAGEAPPPPSRPAQAKLF